MLFPLTGMSTQWGNVCRTSSQAHQNSETFKNDWHDTSAQTKSINNIDLSGVCKRCKNKLEWKIKHKKYNLPKFLYECEKCEQETLMEAYQTICIQCAKLLNVCTKCGKNKMMVEKLEIAKAEYKNNCEKLFRESKNFSLKKKCAVCRFIDEQTNFAGPVLDLSPGSEALGELQDAIFKTLEYLKAKKEDEIDEI